MFVTGKVEKPWSFKNITFLPCRYRINKKLDGWSMFEDWVRGIDKKFASEGSFSNRELPCPSSNRELKIGQVVFLPTEHNFSDSASGSGCDSLTECTIP